MLKWYHFITGYGKRTIQAGTFHTALHRLGEELETVGLTWKKTGKYNFHIVLDHISTSRF